MSNFLPERFSISRKIQWPHFDYLYLFIYSCDASNFIALNQESSFISQLIIYNSIIQNFLLFSAETDFYKLYYKIC